MTDRHFRRLKPLPGEDGYGCYWIGTAIAAGSSILGGLMGQSAAEDAADAQAAAIQAQVDLQREMYRRQRKDLKPWRETGQAGINRLAYLTGIGGEAAQPGDVEDALLQGFTEEDFRADPGYQFRMAEGEKALNRAAAARGMWGNPATVRELQRFSGGLADQTYGDAFNRFQAEQANRFNRLATLSGVGQTAANQTAVAARNYANMGGQALANLGAAQSAGILGGANAMIQGLTGAGAGIGNQMAFQQGLGAFGGGAPIGYSTPAPAGGGMSRGTVGAFGYRP